MSIAGVVEAAGRSVAVVCLTAAIAAGPHLAIVGFQTMLVNMSL